MKLKTKKRIAKEVIILICGFLLALLMFLSVYPYNRTYQSKINKLNKTISNKEKLIDSLSISYNAKSKKQNWFYSEISKDFDMSNYKTSDENWSRLQEIIDKDSLEYQYINKWSKDLISFLNNLGFKNEIQFKEFILLNSFTNTEKIDHENASLLKSDIERINSEINEKELTLLSFEEQKAFAIKMLFIILIILYPLRFLFLIIIWSFRILRQQED